MIPFIMPPTSSLNIFHSCDDALEGIRYLARVRTKLYPTSTSVPQRDSGEILGEFSAGELPFSTQVHTHKSYHFGVPLGVSCLTQSYPWEL